MLKVVDSWTTQDGEWFASSKPYSIDVEHVGKYVGIPGAGAAHHAMIKSPPSSLVEFFVPGGLKESRIADGSGWVNFPMFGESSYNPDVGEVGPWIVRVDGQSVAEGIGLPYGFHVSTFLVVEDVKPEVPVPEPGTVDKYQLFKNGVEVWSS
jgi:hypothetical protein